MLDSAAIDEVTAQFEAALEEGLEAVAELPDLGTPPAHPPEITELFAIEPDAPASAADTASLTDLLHELEAAAPTLHSTASTDAPVEAALPEAEARDDEPPAFVEFVEPPPAVGPPPVAGTPEAAAPDATVVRLHPEVPAGEPTTADAGATQDDAAHAAPELPRIEAAEPPRPGTRDAIVIELPITSRSRDAAPAGDEAAFGTDAAARGPSDDAGEDIAIGDVSLSRSLYEVLVAEADGHLDVLAHELAVLQFDPGYLPGDAMVRASHTLCGIHRTAGFPAVAATAKSLEDCLAALRDAALPLSAASLPILARAINGLSGLVAILKSRQAFGPADLEEADVVQRELEALRQQAQMRAQPHALPGSAVSSVAPESAATAAPIDVAERASAAPAVTAPARAPLRTSGRLAKASRRPMLPSRPLAPAHTDEIAVEQMRDDVDEQLLPIFLEEAEELFPHAGEQLRAWQRNPADASHALALRRTLHTFKGSARMAGAMRLGELTHRMESRLLDGDAVRAGTSGLFEALDADLDRVAFVLDALREGRTDVPLPWSDETAAATAAPAIAATDTASAALHAPSVVVPMPGNAAAAAGRTAEAAAQGAQELDTAQRAVLRVRADIVDRLVNEAGEVAIARARIEGELRALKASLLELTTSVIRMRSQVREIEIQAESQIQSHLSMRQDSNPDFDPLEFDRFTRFQELTRSLAEGVNDVSTVQQGLLRNIDEADAALVAQARLSRDMQQQLLSIRTVPFGSLAERLYRILRQVAKELDKRVNLDIQGAQVELDRSVLEKLSGPLEHLLRNALDHGIETREAREREGKSPTGQIVVAARQVGNEIAIELTDDGAGLDLERIRQRAIAQGRLAPDVTPTEAQLVDCIFEAGFSTAAKVTAVSGRGIGMDVVRSDIAALGGRVEVSTRTGAGTTFMLYLPLTLAVAQAVLVRAGGRLWALPAPMVEQVQQVKSEQLLALYAARVLEWQAPGLPAALSPAVARRHATRSADRALQSRAVVAHGAGHGGDPCGRDGRQPGSGGQEHRSAACARVRHRGRDGARDRRGRADHQSRAARAARQPARVRSARGSAGRAAVARERRSGRTARRDGGRRLAHRAQDHLAPARPRGLRRADREGRAGRAAGAGAARARRHASRHRDAPHGRLRAHQDAQGRPATRSHSHRDDHVAHRGEASEPRPRAGRRPLPREAVPGRRAAAPPARDARGSGLMQQGAVPGPALALRGSAAPRG